jgi:hypothetical protein
MVIALYGYTTLTFDATTQADFVRGIAILGGFETSRVHVTSITNNDPMLEQTVGGLKHVVSPATGGVDALIDHMSPEK